MKCEICGKEFSNLSHHIKTHDINSKTYYDKYLKTDIGEGICPICGKETRFLNMYVGYKSYCNSKCFYTDSAWIQKQREAQSLPETIAKGKNTKLSNRPDDPYNSRKMVATRIKNNTLNSNKRIREKIKLTWKNKTEEERQQKKNRWEKTSIKNGTHPSQPNGRKRLSEMANSEKVIAKRKETCNNKYGYDFYFMLPDIAEKRVINSHTSEANEKRIKTMLENDTHPGSNIMREKQSKIQSTDEVKLKRYSTKKKNGTFSSSRPEERFYERLLEKFSANDIVWHYSIDERYPFECDFYIKSLDLFIELNLFWMHGGHWFDENNPNDVEKLDRWLMKSKTAEIYTSAINTWTKSDILKKTTAESNNLNYLAFWNESDAIDWVKNF